MQLENLLSNKTSSPKLWNSSNCQTMSKLFSALPSHQREIILPYVKKLGIKTFYFSISMDSKIEIHKSNTSNYHKLTSNPPSKSSPSHHHNPSMHVA